MPDAPVRVNRPDLMPPDQTSQPDEGMPPDVTGLPSAGVLPHGVHPLDNSVIVRPGDLPDANDLGMADEVGERFDRGRAPFRVAQENALAVFQRIANDWTTGLVVATAANGPVKVVGRQVGRTQVSLWVPTSVIGPADTVIPTTAGVLVAPNETEVQNTFAATLLMPGDSLPLFTEAPIWVAVQPGQAIGYVQFVNFYTAPGNPIVSSGIQ
jgi:hypothetical protein